MNIGEKIKSLRQQNQLTQEELADRCELSKGFISLLERDMTSPSIATLTDILSCLGTDLREFFSGLGEGDDRPVVFGADDHMAKRDEEYASEVRWLVPTAQKNAMEPILVTLDPGGSTFPDRPHEGEETGYVLQGSIVIEIGNKRWRAGRGDSFLIRPDAPHRILNPGRRAARFLWISCPPSF
ncbi:MAG: cupin domain-containing protein [Clostridia bacterium]|nr:cupin domain-containing protein [Clostridia bacterium]